MTTEFSESASPPLPRTWRNLWRAHVQVPSGWVNEDFTVYVRAGSRDLAHNAVQLAVKTMFHLSTEEIEEAYYNLTPARELVLHGVSERPGDRLFEVAWQNEKVEAWVSNPVFLVPDAAALFAAWVTAQLDHSSQHATLEGLPLGRRAPPRTPSRPGPVPVRPLRHRAGFLIPGERLDVVVAPAGCRLYNRIQVAVSVAPAALGLSRGMSLSQSKEDIFLPEEIEISDDVLSCASLTAPDLTDFRQGFSVTLEPGQVSAVRQAVAEVRRVLNGFIAARQYLEPWLSTVQSSTYDVEQVLFDLAVFGVLDGIDQITALVTVEEGCTPLPSELRQRFEEPALWQILSKETSRQATPPRDRI